MLALSTQTSETRFSGRKAVASIWRRPEPSHACPGWSEVSTARPPRVFWNAGSLCEHLPLSTAIPSKLILQRVTCHRLKVLSEPVSQGSYLCASFVLSVDSSSCCILPSSFFNTVFSSESLSNLILHEKQKRERRLETQALGAVCSPHQSGLEVGSHGSPALYISPSLDDGTGHTFPFPFSLSSYNMLQFASPQREATESKAFLASKMVTQPTTH